MHKSEVLKYSFQAKIWRYQGPNGWYFVTLPKVLSKKIRKMHNKSEEGWGRLKTTAILGETSWKTAIWFDTKHDSYLLPIKASVRKSEKLQEDSKVSIDLEFNIDKWLIDLD